MNLYYVAFISMFFIVELSILAVILVRQLTGPPKPKKPFKFPEFENLLPPPKMKPPLDIEDIRQRIIWVTSRWKELDQQGKDFAVANVKDHAINDIVKLIDIIDGRNEDGKDAQE